MSKPEKRPETSIGFPVMGKNMGHTPLQSLFRTVTFYGAPTTLLFIPQHAQCRVPYGVSFFAFFAFAVKK
jgi:hypothetical protein